MNYSEIKKLDDESLEQLQEGTGPSDKCICHILAPPDDDRKSLGASIKKAFAFGKKKMRNFGGKGGAGGAGGTLGAGGSQELNIPLVFSKGQNGIYTTKETIKRKHSCGKCGCNSDKIVLKHSYANIRITSPDVSSLCSCPTDCLPEKAKLLNNIKVTVERVAIDPDTENSETSLCNHKQKFYAEPVMSEKKSVSSLINAQYESDEGNILDR